MRKPRQKSWWIPWVFVGAFVVIIAVNGIMISFALNSWTGLETKNPFKAGNNYNATLAAVEHQKQLGWRHETKFVPESDGALTGKIEVLFRDKAGLPITDAAMKVRIMRPTMEEFDQDLTLIHGGDGVYFSVVTFAAKGQWQARIRAKRGDEPYQVLDTFILK